MAEADPLLVPDPQNNQVNLNAEDERAPEIRAIRDIVESLDQYNSIRPRPIRKRNELTCLRVVPELKLIIFKEASNCLNFISQDNILDIKPELIVDEDPTVNITSIIVIPDVQMLIVSFNTTIKAYHIENNLQNIVESYRRDMDNSINSLYYCPDRRLLFCSLRDHQSLLIFGVNGEGNLNEPNQLNATKFLDSIKVHKNTIISTDIEGGIIFWEILYPIQESIPIEFKHHRSKIKLLELSDSGKMLTNSQEHGIRVWNINPPSMQGHLIGHESEVTALNITHNGLKAISGDSNYFIIIWDLNLLTELVKIPMHNGTINKIIVTNNDRHFLTCSSDHKIKIGELNTNTKGAELRGHKDAINDIGLSGSTIYSVSKDKTLMVWELPVQIESQKIDIRERYNEYVAVFCQNNFIIAVLLDIVIVYSNLGDENRRVFKEIFSTPDIVIAKKIKKLQFNNDFFKLYCIHDESDDILMADIDLNNINRVDFISIVEDPIDENKIIIFEILSDNFIFIIDGNGEVSIRKVAANQEFLEKVADAGAYRAINVDCFDHKKINQNHYFAVGKETGGIDLIKVILNNGIVNMAPTLTVTENITNINLLENLNKSITNILILDDKNVAYVVMDECFIYVKKNIGEPNPIVNNNQNDLDDLLTLVGHRKIVTSLIKKTIGDSEFIISVSNDLTVRAWRINRDIAPLNEQSNVSREILNIYETFALQEHIADVNSLIDLPGTNYVATGSIDTSLVLMNIIDKRVELKYLGHKSPIKGIGLTKINIDEDARDAIVSYSKDSIQIWDYSYANENEQPFIVRGANDSIDKYISLSKLKFRDELNENQRFITFGEQKFTYLHLLSYWNSHILLEYALANNFPIVTNSLLDDNSCSPLYYAIKTNSMASIKLFIERINYLSQVNENAFKASCHSIRNEVNILLESSSFAISMFFECIFFRKELPKISNNYEQLPKIYLGDSYVMSEDYFKPQNISPREEVVIEYRTCCIELPMELGSKKSIEFLTSLANCKINNIFRTKLISNIINFKWDSVLVYLYIHAIIFWVLLALIAIIISENNSFTVTILFVIVNTLLLLYEIIQMVTSGFDYIKDPENIFDFFTLVFNATWIFCLIFWQEGLLIFGNFIGWAVVTLGFIRGISSFRVFDNTRYYIKLIQRAISECSAFIVIYIYSTIAFGIMFKASGLLNEDGLPFSTFDYFWRLSYDENLGGLDSNTSTYLFYLSFFLASIINVTIMLNLLISILGDTFDNFQVQAMEVDKMKKLEGILEIEKIFSLFSRDDKKSYIHMCLQVDYDEAETEWEGKIRALDKKIDEVSKKLVSASEKNAKESIKMNSLTQANIRNIYKKIDSMQNSLMNFISEEFRRNRVINA